MANADKVKAKYGERWFRVSFFGTARHS